MIDLKPRGVIIGVNGHRGNYENVAPMRIDHRVLDSVHTLAAENDVHLVKIVAMWVYTVILVGEGSYKFLFGSENSAFRAMKFYIQAFAPSDMILHRKWLDFTIIIP